MRNPFICAAKQLANLSYGDQFYILGAMTYFTVATYNNSKNVLKLYRTGKLNTLDSSMMWDCFGSRSIKSDQQAALVGARYRFIINLVNSAIWPISLTYRILALVVVINTDKN